jgi:hypothetical protein
MLQGHYQNAYVTRDINAALVNLRTLHNFQNIFQFETPVELQTPAGNGTALLKMALAWVGRLQYELIEPVSGLVDIYRDGLPASGMRLHHIAMRTKDWDATLAEIHRQKLSIVLQGEVPGARFLYVDARKTLGHYLEYASMTEELWTALGGP